MYRTHSGLDTPLAEGERVDVLDGLRGFAIFGMWVVNVTIDVGWDYRIELMPLSRMDSVIVAVVELLFSGKFFTIFSFLYGVGLFVQITRAKARGANAVALIVRRSVGLLLIAYLAIAGTAHPGILVDYAVMGIGVLFFVGRRPLVIFAAALVFLAADLVTDRIIPLSEDFADLAVEAEADGVSLAEARAAAERAEIEEGLANEPGVRSAPFLVASRVTLRGYWRDHSSWEYFIETLDVLALILIGFGVASLGAVWDARTRATLARRAVPWLLAFGALGSIVAMAMIDFGLGNPDSLPQVILSRALRYPVASSVMGIGYAAAFVLIYARPKAQRMLHPFAAVGRTALSCYLLTLFLEVFMNLGWGLGNLCTGS